MCLVPATCLSLFARPQGQSHPVLRFRGLCRRVRWPRGHIQPDIIGLRARIWSSVEACLVPVQLLGSEVKRTLESYLRDMLSADEVERGDRAN